MKLRVGIVGLGDAWNSRHRPALLALGDRFEVRAVCDQVAVRGEQAAGEFGAEHVDGFRALIAREDIEAVLILSPQWFGALPILASCEAGKAIYCASPLELPGEQAERVRGRVRDSGVAFIAEFPRRHAPATIRLKELIATRLGPPRLLFCHHRAAVNNGDQDSRDGTSVTVLQPLLELVDWCRYVMDAEPTSVMGVVHHAAGQDDSRDYQMMNLDFSLPGQASEGPMAQISCGQYVPSTWIEAAGFRPPAALQAVCEHGVAFVDLPHTLVWFDQAGRHMEVLDQERPVGEQLLSLFHRTVTSLVRQTASLDDSFRTLAVVRSAEESARTGSRVTLADADG